MERHHKNCEVRLEPDMPHGYLNDTMPGRYRQKEANEAWEHAAEVWPSQQPRKTPQRHASSRLLAVDSLGQPEPGDGGLSC